MGDRRWETVDWKQESGDRRWETGDRLENGDRKQKAGDSRH